MTLHECIQAGAIRLTEGRVHCAEPRQHMELIVQGALSLDPVQLLVRRRETLSLAEVEKIEAILQRRIQGEPLQYILGYEWFWDSKFSVGPGVLIPRKETEHTVDYLLAIKSQKHLRVAELGPGTGNIGISVLRAQPEWVWYAFEKNPETIPYVVQNTGALLPSKNGFHLIPGDFFVAALEYAPYDVVVSNPPYISQAEYETLAPELKAEPQLALVGGEKGIEVLEQLLKVSREILIPKGYFVSEIASEQAEEAQSLAKRHGFDSIHVLKDYAGLHRVLTARKGK